MKEIERIIEYHECHHGGMQSAVYACEFESLAKAIEQYVIKARIEELERIKALFTEEQYWWFYNQIVKRIAELKKGLK